MAVVVASSCSSDLTPSLGTSCGPNDKKKKKRKKERKPMLQGSGHASPYFSLQGELGANIRKILEILEHPTPSSQGFVL